MRISDAEATAVRRDLARQDDDAGTDDYFANKARLRSLSGRACPVCRFYGLAGALLYVESTRTLSCEREHGYSNAAAAEEECAECDAHTARMQSPAGRRDALLALDYALGGLRSAMSGHTAMRNEE